MLTRKTLCGFLILSYLQTMVHAAEIIRITPENYPQILPDGKETDAIIGDYVLRNDRLTVVVADAIPTRHANMTTPRVGGCVIDMTYTQTPNDQLTAYYPTGSQFLFHKATIQQAQGPAAVLVCESEPNSLGVKAIVTYTLQDGQDYLAVEQRYVNTSDKQARIAPSDVVRADTTFTKVPKGKTDFFWVHDEWFRKAYGVINDGFGMDSQSDNRRSTIYYLTGDQRTAAIDAGQSLTIPIKLFCADSLLALKGLRHQLAGTEVKPVTARVLQENGTLLPHAYLELSTSGEKIGSARTNSDGVAKFSLPTGKYSAIVRALGCGETTVALSIGDNNEFEIILPDAPILSAKITEKGKRVPCKLQFQGIDGTQDPDFGPNTQAPGVGNLYYSHNGTFEIRVPAGKYKVLISRGPEYDLVTQTIEMVPSKTTTLQAELVRSVQSPGWISSDPHNHSTPSGDNVTSMMGRVLNLLAEHLEFVPCTEHNRIDTYIPILEQLDAVDLMATCSGMELTGLPLPLNHQNAFPLIRRPGLQDNGAPQTDGDPELQIRRLATWDNNSEKYVQTNHPDLGWMYFDRDGNGARDAGFYRMFAFQDAIEVWGNNPDSTWQERILALEPITERNRNDRLFNWLQLLNQGYRIVGVAATDSHYTNHGSGWIRNYVKCSTDDVTQIDTMEMVREYESGHVVLTTGPFLEAYFAVDGQKYLPGDLATTKGKKVDLKVKVQCPNWFDINRVQVLVNGRPVPKYNFTRDSHPSLFSDKVVKFEHNFAVELEQDAHLIVVATGEGLGYGDVMGPSLKNAPPTAIANPFFVDLGADGFQANGDTLGHPLPIKAGVKRQAQSTPKAGDTGKSLTN